MRGYAINRTRLVAVRNIGRHPKGKVMNMVGKALAAIGAIVLTATAVALPDVCQLKASDPTQVNQSITSGGSKGSEAAIVLPANG
jgi:hypothetical protein